MTPHRRIVSTWPSYLLKRIPADIRAELSAEARERDLSIQDVIRGLLCAEFSLVCPTESSHYAEHDSGTSSEMALRFQPKLARALERRVAGTGRTKREVILGVIEAHYEKGEPS